MWQCSANLGCKVFIFFNKVEVCFKSQTTRYALSITSNIANDYDERQLKVTVVFSLILKIVNHLLLAVIITGCLIKPCAAQ